VRIALGFNPTMPVAEAVRTAQKAEGTGYESIWFHESLYQRDVVTYLSSILTATKELKAASGVINTFTRNPVTAAVTFATLSELSQGRVIMGLGLGSFPTIPKIGYKIFPVAETRPLRRIGEYVSVTRMMWSGEKVAFRGEFYTAQDLQLGFKLDYKVPLYVASLSAQTLGFAGASVDGAILSPALNTVETTKMMASFVAEGERSKNRRVDKASYIVASLDPDVAKARDFVRGYDFFLYQLSEVIKVEALQSYGIREEALMPMKEAWKKGNLAEAKRMVPETAIDALALTGTPDAAKDRLAEYVKAGVDLPIIMPIGNVGYAIDVMSPRHDD
jgi:alkanesulfonate monooxygenase SsuD/methylene tetrahydromethanopterin reductase-like flavin-dependent oxidoreductase (luciferase family)